MTDPLEHRVLVLAPTGRDAANTERLLTRAGFAVHLSQDAPGLCAEVARGAGAVLLTEEALTRDTDGVLPAMLLRQPAWSDLPFIVLTAGGPDSPGALHATQTLGNVILLERPVRVSTCVVAARTALRARERQYQTRALLAELRDADRRKDEFLAMLAHELRNPLAPLRNAADLLKLLAFSRDELQGVEDVVDRQVTALTRLVDDLLDVSRITRGKIELRRERISVAELLARAVELSQPLLDSRSHQLQVNVPAQELWLDGDLTRLTQVLANLLNNAAKYTPPGGEVSLSAWRENGDVVLCVQDNGIGIAPQQLTRVFELFTQLDTAHDRSHGGLGVGLTLVRSLVEMHGGTVRAYSDGAGRGCRFNVRLPAAPAAPLLRHAPEPMARRAAH